MVPYSGDYKRATYFRERMSTFCFTDPPIPHKHYSAILTEGEAFLSSEEGTRFSVRCDAADRLRLGKEEVKLIIERSGMSKRKYLEKWRSLSAKIQRHAWKVPARPTYDQLQELEALFKMVDKAWFDSRVRGGRRNIIPHNFIIPQLFLHIGGQSLYDRYIFEFPKKGDYVKLYVVWMRICKSNEWAYKIALKQH